MGAGVTVTEGIHKVIIIGLFLFKCEMLTLVIKPSHILYFDGFPAAHFSFLFFRWTHKKCVHKSLGVGNESFHRVRVKRRTIRRLYPRLVSSR